MKYILLFILLTAASAWNCLSESFPRFRGGTVVSSVWRSQDSAKSATAAETYSEGIVSVMLDRGRSITIYDYVLVVDGRESPCIAISHGDETFSSDGKEYSAASSRDGKLSMLFKMKITAPAGEITASLKFKLLNTGLCETPLHLINSALTSTAKITENAETAHVPTGISMPDKHKKMPEMSPEEIAAAQEKLTRQIAEKKLESNPDASLVNINTASRVELLALPGIGEGTVDKVISARPYKTIDELLKIRSIRKSNFDRFSPYITAK